MDELLSVHNLRVSFGDTDNLIYAVNGVSFSIYPSEIVALVGESGSGKTVTAKSILSLLPSQTKISKNGTINYCSKNIINASEKELQKIRGNEISLIFQNSLSGLTPTIRVGKQICEGLCYHKKVTYPVAKQQALFILNSLDLKPAERIFNSYPHTLSGGQRQRVMIAMAIICNPRLLIADEPTTALDESIKRQILNIFVKLKDERQISTLLITHDIRILANVANRILIMYSGEIVEDGKVDDILLAAKHPYTNGLINSLPERQCNRKQTILTIPGYATRETTPFAGCPFADRCENAINICHRVPPPFVKITDHHTCKCWLLAQPQE